MLKVLATVTTILAYAGLAVPAFAGEEEPVHPGLAQDYDPAPAMWLLRDEDTTIYLLGTVHLLPPGFRWRNPQLEAIIAEAEALVLESNDADSEASLARLGPKVLEMLEGRERTSHQLSPDLREKWRRLAELNGLSFELVDTMPLMVAMMSFGSADIAGALSTYENGVETVLTEEFEQQDRPVLSIEDFGQVMYSLYRANDAAIIADLQSDLRNWDGKSLSTFFGADSDSSDASDWELEHMWARGELYEEATLGLGDGKLASAFVRVLLTDRNNRWAAWLDQRLEQPGTILVAVGAGHFEGDTSVLTMLGERGLEAVRIN